MNKKQNKQQLEREKAVFQYTTALERGDFERVSDVLQQAEEDVVLERMIMEVNEVYSCEFEAAASDTSASVCEEIEHQDAQTQVARRRQRRSSKRPRVQYGVVGTSRSS